MDENDQRQRALVGPFDADVIAYLAALVRLGEAKDWGEPHYQVIQVCARYVGSAQWNKEWPLAKRLTLLRAVYRRAFGEASTWWKVRE